jgi:hypothetical protein
MVELILRTLVRTSGQQHNGAGARTDLQHRNTTNYGALENKDGVGGWTATEGARKRIDKLSPGSTLMQKCNEEFTC